MILLEDRGERYLSARTTVSPAGSNLKPMAEIFPFRALRYNQAAARSSISSLVTQPYDKITPEMQQRYYAASPYNLVRIILGKLESGDNEKQNVYTRAAVCFQDWRAQQILIQDAQPSIYLYSQQFRAPGENGATLERTGFIGLGKIHDYSDGVVFRHEMTLAKPKADRLNLLRATQAHFGQIFMLYSDPAGAVGKLLCPSTPPDISLPDEYGVLHRLWKISHQHTIASVQSQMAAKKLIIADGHHRYETALAYRNERKTKDTPQKTEAAYEYAMMTYIRMQSPGLVILPTHRVLAGLHVFDESAMFETAKKFFVVEELGPSLSSAELMLRLEQAGSKMQTSIMAVTPRNAYLLHTMPGRIATTLAGLPPRQQKLDVVQLHKLLLEGVLRLSEESIRNQENIQYVRDFSQSIAQARSGQANVAFLMNPVRMEQLREVAFAGETMPQKSTDFYPKLLSGLTIYALD